MEINVDFRFIMIIIGNMVKDGYKQCKDCQEIKPFDDFYKDIRLRDKLRSQCKQCIAVLNAEYRETWADNVKVNRAASAKFRSEHQDSIRQYKRNAIAKLTGSYIKDKLAQTHSIVNPSPELIELKRNQLLYKRALKELQNTIKGGKENGSD